MKYKFTIGALIAKRKELNMSQREVGEMIGVDRVTVWRWETGKDIPRVEVLVRWMDALGLEPGDVIKKK